MLFLKRFRKLVLVENSSVVFYEALTDIRHENRLLLATGMGINSSFDGEVFLIGAGLPIRYTNYHPHAWIRPSCEPQPATRPTPGKASG